MQQKEILSYYKQESDQPDKSATKSIFRCVILFPTTILILEITSNVNSYIMKKKISLDKLTLKKAENKATLILYNGIPSELNLAVN